MTTHDRVEKLQLWAGVEATVNRVGNDYFDQLERSGHANRLADLDLIADLGVSAVRYPVLWERTAPNGLDSANWSWADERLARLRDLGVDPIVGLVHHGSGPLDTSLIDPNFPARLAEYAGAVARRYPWLRRFTPINEPLTTARFSGLYGHWYPHGRDGRTFVRALLTQCRAIVLAMQAIRNVIPDAELIQTEDVGRVTSTPLLAYQADYENERRWLSFDLLHGRVDETHALWPWLRDNGVTPHDIDWFREHACPPDILGINTYLTSERFLDEQVDAYPTWSHGGNGTHHYADVHAVIARRAEPIDIGRLLRDVWDRYERPMAVTEAHLGGGRESQLRWLDEIWQCARRLRDEGVDLRAVTAWSVFGAFDWNSLVTRDDGFYESGAYDVRFSPPRKTAVARMLRGLACGQHSVHPVQAAPGYWRLPDRHMFPVTTRPVQRPAGPPLLIVGGSGTLGGAFARTCRERGLAYDLVSRPEMGMTRLDAIHDTIDRLRPWAVVNAAGNVRADDAEYETSACLQLDSTATANLATACAERGLPYVTFSSGLGRDGARGLSHGEGNAVNPLNVYGESSAETERMVLAIHPRALVIRSSAFFNSWDEDNVVTTARRDLAAGRLVMAVDGTSDSSTAVRDLVGTTLDLLIDGEHGCWHLANDGAISQADLARQPAARSGRLHDVVIGQSSKALDLRARCQRPKRLASERATLPPLEDDPTRSIGSSDSG